MGRRLCLWLRPSLTRLSRFVAVLLASRGGPRPEPSLRRYRQSPDADAEPATLIHRRVRAPPSPPQRQAIGASQHPLAYNRPAISRMYVILLKLSPGRFCGMIAAPPSRLNGQVVHCLLNDFAGKAGRMLPVRPHFCAMYVHSERSTHEKYV